MKTPLMLMLYAIYTVASVAGLLLLKTSARVLLSPEARADAGWAVIARLAGGSLLYVGSFAVWLLILARAPLSTAYPIAIALTLCVSTVAAAWWLDESMHLTKLAGIALVLIGVVVLFRDVG